MKKIFKINFMLIACFSLVMCISGSTIFASEGPEIKNVVEHFISNSFNFSFSDYDTSLIDKDSKVFIEFFNKRNHLREKALNYADYTPDNLKYESKSFNYNSIKIENDIAYVNVDETSYLFDKTNVENQEPGVNTITYDIVLSKHDNKWYIWSCSSNDYVVNEMDREIDIKKLASIPVKNIEIPDSGTKSISLKSANDISTLSSLKEIDSSYNKNMMKYKDSNKNLCVSKGEIYTSNASGNALKARGSTYQPNRVAMKEYMRKYNGAEYGALSTRGYNKHYKDFVGVNFFGISLGMGGDCANFGSQILVAGGAIPGEYENMDGERRYWDTKNGTSSSKYYGHAWTIAKYLRGFIIRNTGVGPHGRPIKYGSKLVTGDLCFLDDNASQDENSGKCYENTYSHTTIVVHGGPNFTISAHTNNRYNVPINTIHPVGKYNGCGRSYIKIDYFQK